MQAASHAEAIATSAAVAAWAGACASTFASVVALGVAVWSARREEARRQRLASEQEIAFCFGMVGALERLKPLIAEAWEQTGGEVRRREFRGVIEHTQSITQAALAIQVFDMQMLRDAYGFQGVLGMLRTLLDQYPSGPIPCGGGAGERSRQDAVGAGSTPVFQSQKWYRIISSRSSRNSCRAATDRRIRSASFVKSVKVATGPTRQSLQSNSGAQHGLPASGCKS